MRRNDNRAIDAPINFYRNNVGGFALEETLLCAGRLDGIGFIVLNAIPIAVVTKVCPDVFQGLRSLEVGFYQKEIVIQGNHIFGIPSQGATSNLFVTVGTKKKKPG